MSSDSDLLELIQEKSDVRAANYVATSAVALILYDTLLTLPVEVEYIWKGKFRVAAWLYVMAQYPMILALIISLVLDILDLSTPVCSGVLHLMDISYMFGFFGMQGLLVARAYAISGRNFIVLVLLMLPYIGTNLASGILIAAYESCDVSDKTTKALSLENDIGNIFCLILESGVIVVTLYQTWGVLRLSREPKLQSRGDLIKIFVRQGLMHYSRVQIVDTTTKYL